MPKTFKLDFSGGYRSDVQFFYQGQMLNAIPWEKHCYPVPQYLLNNAFAPITVDAAFQISYKIQNNNFIGAAGEPLEALFMASSATPVGGGESLDIDFMVAHKGLGDEGNYGYRTFNFQADGDGPIVGNFKALTAFNICDNFNDTYYVGFVGAVGSYLPQASGIALEDTLVSVDIKIIDIAYNVLSNDIYLIDDSNLYQMSFPSPTLTQITTLPANLSNFNSLIIDILGTVYISCGKGESRVILVYEIPTTNFMVYDSPFRSDTASFILRYSRSAEDYATSKRPIMIASQGDGFGLADNFNATLEPDWEIFTLSTSVFIKSDVVNDICQSVDDGGGPAVQGGIVIATENGLSAIIYNSTTDGFTFLNSTQMFNHSIQTVSQGKYIETDGSGNNGNITIVCGLTTAEGLSRLSFYEGRVDILGPVIVTRKEQHIDQETFVSTVWTIHSPTAAFRGVWIANLIGKGIRSGKLFGLTSLIIVSNTISENYTFELRDFVKVDIFTYYFLFNEVGSSNIDANAVIASYDAQTNTFISGAPGYFLPSDNLWVAGDAFIFRNSENKGSFYYKNIDNLSIDTLESNIITSEGLEGLISTTYAGSIVDIITTVDQFYLLGSRGIEIWQNVGAAGFPFRKENYLSIPYHLLPLSDEETFTLPISRWAYYKGTYVIVCLSNEANVLTIIQIKDGQYKKMQLDNTLFYTLLKSNNDLQDITLQTLNWWGKDYILLGLADSQTVGEVSSYFLISEDNRWAQLDGISGVQERHLVTASMNSIKTVYDAVAGEFFVYSSPSLPTSFTLSELPNNYVVDSLRIEDESEFIVLNRILIHLDFPIDDLGDWPVDAVYTVSISEDGGRNFSIIEGPLPLTVNRRQVDCSYTKGVLEAIIRFECNYPIIVVGGVAYYEKEGIE